jgi:hypothetical protein
MVYIAPRAWYDGTTIQTTKGMIMDEFMEQVRADYFDEMERDWES